MNRGADAEVAWWWIATLQTTIGSVLVAAGLVLTPPCVTHVLADGHLSNPWPVLAVDLILVVLGAYALRAGSRTRRERRSVSVRRIQLSLAAMGVSTLLSLALAEGIVRVAVDPLVYISGDAWWEHQWRQAHAARKIEPNGVYPFDEFDSHRGWGVKADFRNDSVQTNAMGIRANREYDLQRVPGNRRIVLIGDSFTWGEGVKNSETFARLLEERLDRTEVINLGVHGYGTDQQLLYLRELGLRFRPDIVVLGLFEEDVNRNVLSFRDYAKPRFVPVNGGLELINTPVPEPNTILSRPQELPVSRLGALVAKSLQSLVERTIFRTPLSESAEMVTTIAILEAARRESEASGAKFVLMFIPWSNFEDGKPVEEELARWASESGTDYLDLTGRFASLPPEQRARLYAPGGHWTAQGHAVVASILIDHLGLSESAR
jgi:hypothetical protein